MRRTHSTPFYDVDAEQAADDADVTREFWGATRGWTSHEHAVTRPDRTGRHAPVRREPRSGTVDADATGPMQILRDGVAAFRPRTIERRGDIDRTRSHGIVRPDAGRTTEHHTTEHHTTEHRTTEHRTIDGRDSTIGELGAGAPTWRPTLDATPTAPIRRPHHGDPTDPTPRPRHSDVHDEFRSPLARRDDDGTGALATVPVVGIGSVDPKVVRFGLVAAVLTLMVPLALALRPAGASESLGPDGTPIAAVGSEAIDAGTDTEVVDEPATTEAPELAADPAASATADEAPATPASDIDATVATTATAPAAQGSTDDPPTTASLTDATESDDDVVVGAQPQRAEPSCPQQYVTGAGDSWYRIAQEAGIGVDELLAENGADVDTVLHPGQDVCLTAAATVPSQPTVPTTTAPATSAPTTDAPAASTQAPTTAAPTTAAPTTDAPTTDAPATTAAPSAPAGPPASADEVQALIREIWPADQHETALKVAYRESRYNPLADNGFCCYGVFQIYYSVHRSWLDDYGIYAASDLLDARKNITAALALYERAGGWGPWAQTAY